MRPVQPVMLLTSTVLIRITAVTSLSVGLRHERRQASRLTRVAADPAFIALREDILRVILASPQHAREAA